MAVRERSSNSADRLLRPAPATQAMELRAVLGAFGGPGTLHEHGLEPRSALAQARRFAFAGTLVLAGAQPGPGDEVSRSRKAAHVAADLGQDGGCRQQADARDCAQASDQFAKGRLPVGRLLVQAFDLVSDLLVDLPDRRIERIPLPQMQLQQKTVMLAQPAMQRVMERRGRRLDAALGQSREPVWVTLAADHGFDHPPTAR